MAQLPGVIISNIEHESNPFVSWGVTCAKTSWSIIQETGDYWQARIDNVVVIMFLVTSSCQMSLKFKCSFFSENLYGMISGGLMVLLVVLLVTSSTVCLVVLGSYFSALPINKKNLVTR